MRILINERLSEHKYKTPEGYLICTDAIIARTGKQEYRKNEIFADSDDDSIIELDRPADEVFSEKTIASFENKPLVNEHPDEDVNTENYKDYAVGFIRDVHKGTVDGQDVLLANLVFTDKDAIEDIESGRKNELSCGYDCDIVDEKNPKQTNIRGNHVALCERGRAGIAKIVDSVKDNSIFYKAYVNGKVYFSYDREELEKMNPEKIYVLKKDGDIIKDVNPRSGESKEDFISRFMSETKEEYPDEKQRLAVAYSYWKKGKGTDTMLKDYAVEVLHEDGTYYKTVKVDYDGKYDSEIILKEFYKKHPEFKSDRYKVQIVQDSMEDEMMNDEFRPGEMVNYEGLRVKVLRKLSNEEKQKLSYKLNPNAGDYYEVEANSRALGKSTYVVWERRLRRDSIKDSLTRQERELCDYMLENAYEKGMTAERLWRKMLVYYSEYANLARSKKEDVLDYFEEEIENSMYDSTPYEKQTTELEKAEERFEDAGKEYEIIWTADELKGDQTTVVIAEDEKQAIEKWKRTYSNMTNKNKKIKKIILIDDSINDAAIGVDEEIFNKITQNEHVTKEVTKLNEIARRYNANKRTMYQVILFWTGKDDVAYELSQKLNVRDSVKDATELSAKSIDDLDEQIKRYQKLHPTWKFGEIRKERGLYRVNVITDSMKDAQTYVIKYKLLEYNMITKREFNANSVEEVLKKFARQIGAQGIGTYNVFVVSISPNDGYISLYGRLSKLLDEFNIKWYDSIKDSKHIKAIKAVKAIKQHRDSKLKDVNLPKKGQYSKDDEYNFYYWVLLDVLGYSHKPTFNDRTATGIRAFRRYTEEEKKETDNILNRNNIPHKWNQNRLVIETRKVNKLYSDSVKDSKVKDSDRLKQLAYKFAQQANYFDRANSPHSREILSRDDEQKWVEFKRTALEIKKQLEMETKNVKLTTKGDYFGSSDNETIQLLQDANNTFYFKSQDKPDKMAVQLSKQIDNLLTIYSKKIYNPYYSSKDSKIKDDNLYLNYIIKIDRYNGIIQITYEDVEYGAEYIAYVNNKYVDESYVPSRTGKLCSFSSTIANVVEGHLQSKINEIINLPNGKYYLYTDKPGGKIIKISTTPIKEK